MGDWVKGDKVGGNKVGGDMVGGDKVSGNKGDTYNVKDSIGVGGNVEMKDVDIYQHYSRTNEELNLNILAGELKKLSDALISQAGDDTEKRIAVGEIAKAELAAQNGESSKTLEYLSGAGTWVLEVAKSIGVPVAIEALKRAAAP